jgi:hypothetical protein
MRIVHEHSVGVQCMRMVYEYSIWVPEWASGDGNAAGS